MRYTSQNLSLLRIRSKAPHVLWKKDSTMGSRKGSSSCYYRRNHTDAAHSVKLQRYFEEMVKENLRQSLYKTPYPLQGLPFLNGFLTIDPRSDSYTMLPPQPGQWAFTRGGTEFLPGTPLTGVQKRFLIDLMDGNPFKINLLRAFLKLLFTQNNKEQVCLYLWGPGATGKSTLVQLLESILGESCCALDILRLTNRFEMRAVQDKILLTLPDIPSKVNNAQCSVLKKIISGDRVTCEVKNAPIYAIDPKGLLIVTANTMWDAQDRTSGFRRRILYLLTPRAAIRRDPYLLTKLKRDASGLVNWALDMPAKWARIGQSVEAINDLSGGGRDVSGVLEWLFSCVKYHPPSEMPLGARKIPIPGGLHNSYIQYTEANGIEPVIYLSFGEVFNDSLRSLGYRDIVIKRKMNGRMVKGISLEEGEPIRRSQRSDTVKYLMEREPWEGFFEESPLEEPGEERNDDYDDYDDYDDHDDLKESGDNLYTGRDQTAIVNSFEADNEEKAEGQDKRPLRLGERPVTNKGEIMRKTQSNRGSLSCLIEEKVGSLTGPEAQKTEDFLSKYPWLKGALAGQREDWPIERLVDEAKIILQRDYSMMDKVEEVYGSIAKLHTVSIQLPPTLCLSTTMDGLNYPLAPALEQSIDQFKVSQSQFQSLFDLINRAASPIVDTVYMLFRLFRRQGSTSLNRRCPIKRLFATSYTQLGGYPRLIPQGVDGAGTISCLKRECKKVLKELLQGIVIPPHLAIEELDMVACHTGIYAGLTGRGLAPNTLEAYKTGHFWSFIMSKWGEDIPKKLLKTLLYAGLNGASLTGAGAIREQVMDFCMDLDEPEKDVYLQRVLRHPILQELALFQSSLNKREKIYLPSRVLPYYGKVEEELSGKPGGSRYHGGLLSSRILASHEIVLLAYLIEAIYQKRLGIPLSLENDGLLILTQASQRDLVFDQLDSFLKQQSTSFLGVNISLERED